MNQFEQSQRPEPSMYDRHFAGALEAITRQEESGELPTAALGRISAEAAIIDYRDFANLLGVSAFDTSTKLSATLQESQEPELDERNYRAALRVQDAYREVGCERFPEKMKAGAELHKLISRSFKDGAELFTFNRYGIPPTLQPPESEA